MSVNEKERSKLEREIGELKKKQSNAKNTDQVILNTALVAMLDTAKSSREKFDDQIERKRIALNNKKFTSLWDPKIKDALEIARRPLQSYGEKCEKASEKMLKAIEKGIENGASEKKCIECINKALSVLKDAEDFSITVDQLSKVLKYIPSHEGKQVKKELERLKTSLSKGEGPIGSKLLKKQKELQRILKADGYGISVAMLDTHEDYLTAIKYYEKAKTGEELRASAGNLKKLGNYLTANALLVECNNKLKDVEVLERLEKAVNDTKFSLSEAENEQKNAEKSKAANELGLKKAEKLLHTIESGMKAEKDAILDEYNKKCRENESFIKEEKNKLSELGLQKSETEIMLKKTFFLAFRKKKALSSSIETLDNLIATKNEEIKKAQEEFQGFLIEKDARTRKADEKLASAQKSVREFAEKLSSDIKRIENAGASIVSCKAILEKAMQEYKEAIEKHKERVQDVEEKLIKKENERPAIETKTEELTKTDSTNTYTKHPIIADVKLAEAVNCVFDKLDKMYPEHKVFALDSLNGHLRERITELYKKAGYETSADMLNAYGYEIISGEEVKALRSSVIYTPGNEPEIIKNNVENMLKLLNEYYPDHIISRGIQQDHKNLSQTISGLYQWLGYEDAQAMLKAYGFEYSVSSGGRQQSNDYQSIVEFLAEKYSTTQKPSTIGEIVEDNPELKGPMKTMMNKSNELFGMSLKDYLIKQKVIGPRISKSYTEKKKIYHYLKVTLEGSGENVMCLTQRRIVMTGSLIEMTKPNSNEKCMGRVTEECYNIEEDELPIPIDDMYQYFRKISAAENREMESSAIKYPYCLVQFKRETDTKYYLSPFEDVEVGEIVEAPWGWYGTAYGTVIKIKYFSKKEIPQPLKSAKKIKQILKGVTEIPDMHYIYCSVKVEGGNKPLYYISPFEDVEIGDIVEVSYALRGIVPGVVVDVKHVTDRTAPYPPSETKRIMEIIRRGKEKELIKENIQLLAEQCGTDDFQRVDVGTDITKMYERMTYFSSAVFRGLEFDVERALELLYPDEYVTSEYRTEIEKGVSQFECSSADVPRIIKEFPNLKGLFFAESWRDGKVYLAYSESGYDSVTEMKYIGGCNFYCRGRWTLLHDPSEDSFKEGYINYIFSEKEKWESCDFVLPEGNRKLAKGKILPSKPYIKQRTDGPCKIIEIRYPENEIFYVEEPKQSNIEKNIVESSDLIGKCFVVTGGLNNYSSRDELKILIEKKGGKLTGSVSSKTTALITNYPDSGTSKIETARELGVEIIDEFEFAKRYLS